ncbi:MAG: hypothetical protein ACYDDS_21540 [Candidatus Sulfotelmatobacter sp.]
MVKRYYQQVWEVDEVLAKSASDPNCKNQQECLDTLTTRKAKREEQEERKAARVVQEKIRRETVRAELQDNPFDPRSEISADAQHIAREVGGRIVKHLWIIFVALPFVLGLLYAILK